MLTILLALAAGAYSLPSETDAERAVAGQLLGGDLGASLDPSRPGYDLVVRLDRCVPQESYEVRGPFGVRVLDYGHECVMTISRRARPDYQARGFFHHDGYGWRYYGPTGEPLIAETQTHGINGSLSTATPKPGSILYRGDAIGETADPYARILSGYDWFRAPSE
jgi:hypothetical protein